MKVEQIGFLMCVGGSVYAMVTGQEFSAAYLFIAAVLCLMILEGRSNG